MPRSASLPPQTATSDNLPPNLPCNFVLLLGASSLSYEICPDKANIGLGHWFYLVHVFPPHFRSSSNNFKLIFTLGHFLFRTLQDTAANMLLSLWKQTFFSVSGIPIKSQTLLELLFFEFCGLLWFGQCSTVCLLSDAGKKTTMQVCPRCNIGRQLRQLHPKIIADTIISYNDQT